MEIIFRNNSTEDDVVSIINLLKLGNKHQRVKKYICEFFSCITDEKYKNFKTKYIKSQYSFNLLFRQKRECIGVFKQCY